MMKLLRVLNARLLLMGIVFTIGVMLLVGCQADGGGEADEGEQTAQATKVEDSGDGQSQESTLKVNLVQPEEREEGVDVEHQGPVRVERREVEVAVEDQPQQQTKVEPKRKYDRQTMYADRPDPFAESRIKKLESSLEPFEAVQVPEQAMNDD